MNQKDLALKRNDTQRKYRTPNCPLKPRPRNAIFISPANSLKHEMKKLQICYELAKSNVQFITEAEEISTGKRRDIVNLDTGEVIEVETNSKRAKRHDKDITVIMA